MSEATAKIRNVAAIPLVLRELGADVEAVLRQAGLDPLIFSNSENVMPYAALGRLLNKCVQVTGCESFGLRVGAKTMASAIGLTGLVSLHSSTVREALRVINDTLKTSETGGATFLDVHGGQASFGYAVTAPNIEAVDQIEDGSVAIAINIMRQLCGPAWRANRVRLSRNRPRDKTPFLQFFETQVDFNEACSCFEFDAATLEQPVQGRRPEYEDVLAPLLELAAANTSKDFLSTVKLVIRSQIGTGNVSRDSVCLTMGIGPRTLAKRLESYGLSYSSLTEEIRFETAQSLLKKEIPIADIATQLGFADQSAFSRAFRTWSGSAPARWRAARRDENH
ncbi:AraC family transcriptional regulator [Bradyrhizobium lablabi]|uniref:AraC family transcriptional regulator n=1 Tax=Bradyrhizobium lablabi TaxID=722472 RepID=UPI00289882E9|nr:AraC family transcriptional regulator [Bradyrhizobium lablabi]MBR0698058.1 AraC family transcriptional regulator [Bradyrhizobium lablabi]